MNPKAKKQFGQNFLRDESVVSRIVASLDLSPDETVIEIGPGTGALTAELSVQAGRVIAIEFDRDLIAPLNERFGASSNVTIVNSDALDVDLTALIDEPPVKLAANLPYNISTAILQRLIEHRSLFSRLVLMFQREVVDRITASPGTKDRGFLTILTEDAFDAKRLFDVSPHAFVPVPKVWSSVVELRPKPGEIVNDRSKRNVVSRSFLQKRKTILNNLKGQFPNAAERLAELNIDATRRAETLTLDEWRRLANILC